MPKLCPECEYVYSEKVTAKKMTIPEGATVCHHDVEFEGDTRAGVWYIHGTASKENADR